MSRLFVLKPQDGTFAVLGIDRKGFVCHSCKYGRHSCSHVCCLADLVQRGEEELPDFICELIAAHQELAATRIETFILKTVSSGKVPWVTTPTQRLIYKLSIPNSVDTLRDGLKLLMAEDFPCESCSGSMDNIAPSNENYRLLLLWADVIPVKGVFYHC